MTFGMRMRYSTKFGKKRGEDISSKMSCVKRSGRWIEIEIRASEIVKNNRGLGGWWNE